MRTQVHRIDTELSKRVNALAAALHESAGVLTQATSEIATVKEELTRQQTELATVKTDLKAVEEARKDARTP